MGKRKIAILGSTGSIGTQALDVIRQHRDLFEDESCYPALNENLSHSDCKVFAGIDSLCSLVSAADVDIVVGAMVGFSGLRPTLAALRAGKIVALANKETLVAAGNIVTRTMR